MESSYYDLDLNRKGVEAGKHRALIGDMWDEVGKLQFDYMKSEGLQPEHKLLDVGCGALRGGVHFVRYLAPSHYFGSDMNQAFLDSGYDIELAGAGLQDRLPRENLICSVDFDLDLPEQSFDYALAQSVFTHLSLNNIRLCLTRMAPLMKAGGTFYATFFELPEGAAVDEPIKHQPGGKVTHAASDPYHYGLADFEFAVRGLPWTLRYVGDWDHPRAQRMIAFVKTGQSDENLPSTAIRSLSVDEASRLQAGEDHYRAYVGPPNRFDFMSATQFSLLFQCGMRDHHKVLDFGAGSLRLGRLLIPYLRPGGYHAIEPNQWLVDDALAHELGRSIVDIKKPVFSTAEDFDCSVLDSKFDFIMAQSIVTHCESDLFQKLMKSFADVLEDDGIALFSYWNTPEAVSHGGRQGWVYPGSVRYTEAEVEAFLSAAGLVGVPIPWYHPGASWYLAAKSAARLPSPAESALLRGAVLFDPQFAASRVVPAAGDEGS